MKNTNNYINKQSNNSEKKLKLEDIKTIDEGAVYLSMTDTSGKQLSLDEITVAQKTHGQNGIKNAYFNYVYMIVKSIDKSYELFLPLLILNKNANELIEKAEYLITQIKACNMQKISEVEIHPKAVFIGFYLLKNYLLPDLKAPKFGGVR